ncbi:hypothetical protein D3C78_1440670 [compost metagenome]
MGIIAFVFTVLRFYQERRPLAIDEKVTPYKFKIPIFDRNDNEIDALLEDCLSVELTLVNKSSRSTMIRIIQHDSSFDFRVYYSEDEWNSDHYETSILIPAGQSVKIKRIVVPLQQEILNVTFITTHKTIKHKIRITGK